MKFFLDIETIPTQNLSEIMRIGASITAPAQYKKPESIAEWMKENAKAATEEAIAKTALNGAYGQICCIGMAFDAEDVTTISWPSEEAKNERELLKWFSTFAASSSYRHPTVIGHNVVNFDIRFIWQRAMVNGVRLPAWFPRDPKPWGSEAFDTMTAWAGAGYRISLDELCRIFGLPGKGDVDGSMVGKMWSEGKHKEIAEYCKADVERVRSVYRKMQVALGASLLEEAA